MVWYAHPHTCSCLHVQGLPDIQPPRGAVWVMPMGCQRIPTGVCSSIITRKGSVKPGQTFRSTVLSEYTLMKDL